MTYKGVEADYWDLKRVSIWDVGCERQVEITGPDAAAFTQYLVTRDVNKIEPGRAATRSYARTTVGSSTTRC